MASSAKTLQRLEDRVRRRNRELAGDAILKASLGVVFTLLTFGFIFWGGWVFGWLFARSFSLDPWQFSLILTGVFFVVAVWSACAA